MKTAKTKAATAVLGPTMGIALASMLALAAAVVAFLPGMGFAQ